MPASSSALLAVDLRQLPGRLASVSAAAALYLHMVQSVTAHMGAGLRTDTPFRLLLFPALSRPPAKQTDCAYQEVKEVRTVSRGLGAWGDMVIELKNGDKLELRSLEK